MTWLLIGWIVLELDLRLFSHRYFRSRVPRWLGCRGITLGRYILVDPAQLSTRTLAHECCHVDQFRRYSIPGFMVIYAVYTLLYGYYMNPLEVQARDFATLIQD